MSTFDGHVAEFPQIRIDYFRTHVDRPQPLGCFLSHVHSDHILGLDSLKMPFVYCSATTRRLLLRMEKYPHRMNFAKGILETRKQHYRHLKSLLRSLPLQTPTEIELSPKLSIRVTLFDANHCPGAVMFLIEGAGKAILYTGDVRAEPWWVNSIVQNTALLRYAAGLGKLDCIYLDTTFATHDNRYKRFPGKAEGLRELMTKVSGCDPDCIFYFRAWTLGYEQVWMALSDMLKCKVHVDGYQMRLFTSIVENGRDGYSMFEGPALAGFQIGNHIQPGCLSRDRETRLHSCEPGLPCHSELKHKKVVWITPIISRMTDGSELLEIGAGGGGGDLYQAQELDLAGGLDLQSLEKLCADLKDGSIVLERIREALETASEAGSSALSLEGLGLDSDAEVSLQEFLKLVSQRKDWKGRKGHSERILNERDGQQNIHFPYSRHSSYEELRHLVSVFQPKDLYACTVDMKSWTEDVSMKSLFGDLCSAQVFHHDSIVRREVANLREQLTAQNLKRKRNTGSQDSFSSSQPSRQSPSFHSARMNIRRETQGDGILDQEPHTEADRHREHLGNGPGQGEAEDGVPDMDTRVNMIKREFLAANNGQVAVVDDAPNTGEGPEQESQESLDTSAFDSQEHGSLVGGSEAPAPVSSNHRGSTRSSNRREAYRLARRSMNTGDSSDWNDMSLQSVGRPGSNEPELDL